MKRILMIYPPHVISTEPPLGVTMIAADLKRLSTEVEILDLNSLVGPALARAVQDSPDHRTHRAVLHIDTALKALQGNSGYLNTATYQTWIEYYSAALRAVSSGQSWTITPGDFMDSRFSDFGAPTAETLLNQPNQLPFFDLQSSIAGKRISLFRPDVIGISLTYRSQFLPTLSLAGWIRDEFSDLPMILGGSFCRFLPEITASMIRKRIGPVVLGEGEPFFRRVMKLGKTNEIPFSEPDFSNVCFHDHLAPEHILPITSSRGCFWAKCTFCAEAKTPFRLDSPESFVDKLNNLSRKHSPCLFHLTDNAIPPVILRALAEKGSPDPWYGFVRASRDLTDLNYVKKLGQSGCRMLQVGIETPVQRLLDKMGKGVDSTHFPDILRNLRNAGIRSYIYLMFGFPGETEKDREETLRFVANNPMDFLNVSIFRLPPQTILAEHPELFGSIDVVQPDPESTYCRIPSQTLGGQALRRWLSKRFLRHPSVSHILSRTPRYFKSNHAVFF